MWEELQHTIDYEDFPSVISIPISHSEVRIDSPSVLVSSRSTGPMFTPIRSIWNRLAKGIDVE
jgi:hypothetical protein